MWFRRIQLQENQERRAFPPFTPPLFGLKNAGFKNE
nr:ORF56 protein [Micromelum minutum]BEV76969.1 ORF56 protein [Micromelum minutum]